MLQRQGRQRDDQPGRKEGRLWLIAGASLFFAFSLLPIAALLIAAVPASPLHRLLDPSTLAAIRLSLGTSLVATFLAAGMGLPVAYLLARFRFPGERLVDSLIDLPMTLPPVVAGLALLLTFGRMGLLGRYLDPHGIRIAFSTAAVVLAQTFMSTPFFIRAARAGLEAVPLELEHAAMTLGRNRWNAFWTISAPLAAPALLAGVVLAWARSLSEFGATMMFAGNFPGTTQTLPLAVMARFDAGDLSGSIAVAVVSLFLAFLALAGTRALVRSYPGV